MKKIILSILLVYIKTENLLSQDSKVPVEASETWLNKQEIPTLEIVSDYILKAL